MNRCLQCWSYVHPNTKKLFCCDECHRQWQQRMAGLKWKEPPTNLPLNQE